MPIAGGGFEQSYNAQAAVTVDSLLVGAPDVSQKVNDKRQVEPMLEQVTALSASLRKIETLLADNGHFSAADVDTCKKKPGFARSSPWGGSCITRRWTSVSRRPRRRRPVRHQLTPWPMI